MIKSNQMRCAKVICCLALLSILSSSQVRGAITLTFSGTYDTQNTTLYTSDADPGTPSNLTVFSLSQPTASVSYSFTFKDNATPIVLAAGTQVEDGNGDIGNISRTLYGYQSSDLLSINASVNGISSWTMSDLAGLSTTEVRPTSSLSTTANFWFDQDISVAAPTRAIFDFDNSGGNFYGTTKGYLIAGSPIISGPNIDVAPVAFIGQYQSNSIPDQSVETQTTNLTIASSVPEPSRAIFLMMGFVVMKLRRKRL